MSDNQRLSHRKPLPLIWEVKLIKADEDEIEGAHENGHLAGLLLVIVMAWEFLLSFRARYSTALEGLGSGPYVYTGVHLLI